MRGRFLAGATAFIGCSQSPNLPSSQPSSPLADAGAVGAGGRQLCGDATFEAQRRSGGTHAMGGAFLEENGYDLLVVDGDCRFVVQESPSDGVREGTLTVEAATQLSASLRVAEWEQFEGLCGPSYSDGPASRVAFGGRVLDVVSDCGSAGKVERVAPILDAVRSTVESLAKSGTRVAGARYALVVEGTSEEGGVQTSDAAYRAAPIWPLPAEPKAVATSFEVADRTPDEIVSHVVEGDDAAKLWAIVDAYTRGEIGTRGYFVPVLDGAGHGYRLYVRGSLPFEDASGGWQIE